MERGVHRTSDCGISDLMIDRQVYYVIAIASAATLIGYLFIPSIKIPHEKGDRLKTLLAGIKYVRDKPIVLGGLTIDLLMVGLVQSWFYYRICRGYPSRGSRGTWIDARNAGDRQRADGVFLDRRHELVVRVSTLGSL